MFKSQNSSRNNSATDRATIDGESLHRAQSQNMTDKVTLAYFNLFRNI